MGSACELECELIIAKDLAFISEEVQNRVLGVLAQVKRMLAGLIRKLFVPVRQKSKERRLDIAPTESLQNRPRRPALQLRTDS